jgi:hypothetical protein
MANDKYTDAELKERYGLRNEGKHFTAIDQPSELGYSCLKGKHGEHEITWSEFNQHIWCYKCNIDYLSFDCPIKRPCWMKKELWKIYGNYPNEYNIKKGRFHPYPDCKKDGKYHRCVR